MLPPSESGRVSVCGVLLVGSHSIHFLMRLFAVIACLLICFSIAASVDPIATCKSEYTKTTTSGNIDYTFVFFDAQVNQAATGLTSVVTGDQATSAGPTDFDLLGLNKRVVYASPTATVVSWELDGVSVSIDKTSAATCTDTEDVVILLHFPGGTLPTGTAETDMINNLKQLVLEPSIERVASDIQMELIGDAAGFYARVTIPPVANKMPALISGSLVLGYFKTNTGRFEYQAGAPAGGYANFEAQAPTTPTPTPSPTPNPTPSDTPPTTTPVPPPSGTPTPPSGPNAAAGLWISASLALGLVLFAM